MSFHEIKNAVCSRQTQTYLSCHNNVRGRGVCVCHLEGNTYGGRQHVTSHNHEPITHSEYNSGSFTAARIQTKIYYKTPRFGASEERSRKNLPTNLAIRPSESNSCFNVATGRSLHNVDTFQCWLKPGNKDGHFTYRCKCVYQRIGGVYS